MNNQPLRHGGREMQRRALPAKQPGSAVRRERLLAAEPDCARTSCASAWLTRCTRCWSISMALHQRAEHAARGGTSTTTCSAPMPSATSASSLQDVTLNPMMGEWLSTQGNDKGNATTDPDENYAREVMQLFTIGLYQLNDDGTQKLDGTGKPIPTYSNVDVQGWPRSSRASAGTSPAIPRTTRGRTAASTSGPAIGEDLLPMQSYPKPPLHCGKGLPRRNHSRAGECRSDRRSQDRSRYAVQSSQSAGILLQADDPAPRDEQSQPGLCEPRRRGVQGQRTRACAAT